MTKDFLRYRIAACLLAGLPILCANTEAQQTTAALQTQLTPSADAEIPAAQLLRPEELMQILSSAGKDRPLILQIGSHVLYAEAHVPGSEYVGAAGNGAGLQALRERVKELRKDQFLVIYCGCCPWDRCPNIRPAYRQLHALGFTHLKVLYLAQNFGIDWVDKGYPVSKGR